MWFDTIEAVKKFAGEEYEKAHVPEKARSLLKRFDKKSLHTELIQQLWQINSYVLLPYFRTNLIF